MLFAFTSYTLVVITPDFLDYYTIHLYTYCIGKHTVTVFTERSRHFLALHVEFPPQM